MPFTSHFYQFQRPVRNLPIFVCLAPWHITVQQKFPHTFIGKIRFFTFIQKLKNISGTINRKRNPCAHHKRNTIITKFPFDIWPHIFQIRYMNGNLVPHHALFHKPSDIKRRFAKFRAGIFVFCATNPGIFK